MIPDPFDRAARYLLRNYPELLGWFLSLPSVDFEFVGWLDTRGIPWPGSPETVRDTLAHLLDLNESGVPWAVAIEFQTVPDPDMLSQQFPVKPSKSHQ